jgi:hypothetical protein
MNGQFFRESLTPTEIVENSDQKTYNLESNPAAFADKTPVDATLLHEVPMGGTVAAVGPMTGPSVDQIPMYETPNQEIPMGGTIAAVSPMNGQLVDEIPMGQTGAAVNLMDGTAVRDVPLGDAVAYNPTNHPTSYQVPMIEKIPVKTPVVPPVEPSALLNREESDQFRTRWNSIQGKFVDDPRTAVQEADTLVTEVIEQITKMFADNHSSLEGQWKQGSDVSTEDLRTSLQHYRSFFNRLVA